MGFRATLWQISRKKTVITTLWMISLLSLISCGKPHNQYQGYVEGENIYIASPYAGKMINAFVSRGMPVKKGDHLFILDPNPQKLMVMQEQAMYEQGEETLKDLVKAKRKPEINAVEAQVEQVNAQIALAQIRVKRNQTLYDKHVLDKDSLDAAVEHLHELTALKAQFEANLALANLGARPNKILAQQFQVDNLFYKWKQGKWERQQKNLDAPADGVIYDTYYKPGEYVSAEQPIAALLTHENTRIEFFVPLRELTDFKVGQDIEFTNEDDSIVHKAVISYISPEAEYMPPLVYSRDNRDKIVFRLKAQVDASVRLFPGEPVLVMLRPSHE